MTARVKGLLVGAAALAAVIGVSIVLSSGGGTKRAISIRTSPNVGIPGLASLGDLHGGVALSAIPRLRSRGRIDTIMQDDATFIYGASDDAVNQAMARAKELGVDRIRLTAGWSVLAPEADDDQKPSFDAADPSAYTHNGWHHYDPIGHWEALDRAVRATVAAGMTPMIDLGFWAPKWATSGDPQTSRRTYNVNAQEYAEFVKAVVTRYSGSYVPTYGTPPPPEQAQSNDSNVLQSVFGSPRASFQRSSTSSGGSFPFNLLGGGGSGSGSGSGGSSSGGQAGASSSATPAPEAAPLPRVSTWTIWNEPNHPGFIQPQWRQQGTHLVPNSPYLYRALVDAAYPVIKSIEPDSTVLVGGTSSMGNEHPSSVTDGMTPLVFLRALACVDAKFRPITSGPCSGYKPLEGDGYAHHPYSLLHTPDYSDRAHPDDAMMGDLSRLTGTLNRLVAMQRIDPKLRNVWLTEYGYESNPPDPIKPFTPEEQADNINWAEYLAWKNPQVRSFPQFLLQDMGKVSPADVAAGKRDYGDWQSGLYFHDGTPKPAAIAFPLALHVDCTTVVRKRVARGKKRRVRTKLLVIWGHVRPGSGPRQVTMEDAPAKAAFRPAATAASLSSGVVRAASVTPFSTDANGYFLRFASFKRGVEYRFTYTDAAGHSQTGLAEAPDSCSGVNRQKRVTNAGANEF